MSHLFVSRVFNNELPFRVEATTAVSPCQAPTRWPRLTLKILRREALTRVLTHPGSSVSRAPTSPAISTSTASSMRYSTSSAALRSLLKIENLRALLSVVGVDTLRPIAPPSIERQAARFLAQSLA